jgi:hypothetical protein
MERNGLEEENSDGKASECVWWVYRRFSIYGCMCLAKVHTKIFQMGE